MSSRKGLLYNAESCVNLQESVMRLYHHSWPFRKAGK